MSGKRRSTGQSWRRFLMLAALLCGRSARAQIDASAWPEVRVEVLALDRNGEPMAIDKTGLSVSENGRPQAIESVEPASGPQSVCLLIDSSGSMFDRRANIRAAAERILQDLPAEDEICVADFSYKLYFDQKLTSERKAVEKSLDRLRTAGGTAMYDAVATTGEYLRTDARYKSRAIILLSDGADNASSIDAAGLKRGMLAGGTPVVHVVRIPSPKGSEAAPSEERSEKKAALTLRMAGGGLLYLPRNTGDIEPSIDSLCRAMSSRYEVRYATGDATANGQERVLNVSLDKQMQKAKAVVRVPEGYYAPSR